MVKNLSVVQENQVASVVSDSVILWTGAHLAPLSMGFSKQEYWGGLPCPPPGDIPCGAGDLGSIPGSGRSPGEGNGNPLQYSCLENPMDRGAW